MTVAETLVKARGLIADPADWSPNGWGNDGKKCAIHALHVGLGRESATSVAGISEEPAFWFLQHAMDDAYPGDFNDDRTHAEVLAAFDRAIALAEQQEAAS